jgi:hypothetical protein
MVTSTDVRNSTGSGVKTKKEKQHRVRWIVLLVLCLSLFAGVVDTSVMKVATPANQSVPTNEKKLAHPLRKNHFHPVQEIRHNFPWKTGPGNQHQYRDPPDQQQSLSRRITQYDKYKPPIYWGLEQHS